MKTIYKKDSNGVEYYRESLMHGGGWYSKERGVVPGTVRVINEVLSQAMSVYNRGFMGLGKPEVHWISIEPSYLRKVDINEKP